MFKELIEMHDIVIIVISRMDQTDEQKMQGRQNTSL